MGQVHFWFVLNNLNYQKGVNISKVNGTSQFLEPNLQKFTYVLSNIQIN
jgi:hypothetical protein